MFDNNDINKTYAQYEGKSESELMSELVKLKQNGAIKDGQMSEMAKKIAPMLNDEQRRRLNTILAAFEE